MAKSATSLFLAHTPVCVSLSKCLNLSEPQFLHPENKDYCVHLVRLLRGLSELKLIYEKHLKQGLAQSKRCVLANILLFLLLQCLSYCWLWNLGAVILHLGQSSVPRWQPNVPFVPLAPFIMPWTVCGDKTSTCLIQDIYQWWSGHREGTDLHTLLDSTPFQNPCLLACFTEKEPEKQENYFPSLSCI